MTCEITITCDDGRGYTAKLDDEAVPEVALGMMARAGALRRNPDDDWDHVAADVRDIGREILREFDDFAITEPPGE